MERIFSKMKIFLLKKIVFPILQLIAKYKTKKKVESKYSKKYYIIEDNSPDTIEVLKDIPIIHNSPKQYGQYLQQTGKQIWVKKLK
jgi:hypothetical protein